MPKNSITDALNQAFGDACVLPEGGGYDAARAG
jgi:hypothetical protein